MLPLIAWLALAAADPIAPASEAAIDAFIAALPPSTSTRESEIDAAELERLAALNHGRGAEVKAALEGSATCQRTAQDTAVTNALRSSARRLGDAQLKRLTEFYSGPDHAIFATFASRIPDKLTPAEQVEFDRLQKAYPLDAYAKSSKQSQAELWSPDGLMNELMKCDEQLESDIAKRGLKR